MKYGDPLKGTLPVVTAVPFFGLGVDLNPVNGTSANVTKAFFRELRRGSMCLKHPLPSLVERGRGRGFRRSVPVTFHLDEV
jgi:hypothetical protein